ncbi:MAG: FIST N-terminal domain-containing protein [Chthoniobacteraceae bacterium]
MPNSAASRLVLSAYSESATAEAARSALHEVGGRVSCAFLFCSADYREQLGDFLEVLQVHGHIPLIVGCSGAGLVGTGREAEGASGFSLLALNLPETQLVPFSFSRTSAPGWDDADAWRAAAGGENADAWMLLADPTAVPSEQWLATWERAFPGAPCFGGLASGGREMEDMFVLRDRELLDGGGVALGFRGGVKIHTLVSQGCRPIGEALPVTGVEENIIQTLGSRPAWRILDDAFQSLTNDEKSAAKGNLFAGLAMTEYREEFHRGDFLIRNILGADQQSGAVAVAAFPRVGQTVQYQLRDAAAADEDLTHLADVMHEGGVKPFASLLFSCGGRGRGLFGSPNHDAGVLAETFGQHSSAGFFCNGEIGPVGGKNFVHGYTASAALFV